MPINDDELHRFLDGAEEVSAAQTFAGAVVKVFKVFTDGGLSEEEASLFARDYWNFLLDNAQTTLEFELELDAEEARSEDQAS